MRNRISFIHINLRNYSCGVVLQLKTQLLVAEKQLEVKGGCVPLILQPLLKKTYECEMARINAEKKESLREMQETKEMVRSFQLFRFISLSRSFI